MQNKTIIEVNGVKLEVDLRSARRIDELKVGDRVKVLKKKYSDEFAIHAGTIVGFEPFTQLPTIIIAYLEVSYDKAEIKFEYFNSKSKDVEIVKSIDEDQLEVNKADVLSKFDREIAKKEGEIADLKLRKEYFVREFKHYWEAIERPAEV
jgi:hypothetical protein